MFNERKVLEEIIYLLKLNNNQLNELKLMKELYLADRLSIKERGHSISFDSFFSLPHGPILSNTLNLLNTEGIWDDYISKVEKDYYIDIEIKKETDFIYLSKKDRGYLEAIAKEYKDTTDEWFLRNCTRILPEYNEEYKKIKLIDILKALNFTNEEIKEIKNEQYILNYVDNN